MITILLCIVCVLSLFSLMANLISLSILAIVFLKYHNLIIFKFKNNFKQIFEVFSLIQDGNPSLNETYRKAIKFIREMELMNFGLNM